MTHLQPDPSPYPADAFAAFELLSSAILVIDDDGLIRYANAPAEDLFEVSVRQLYAVQAGDLFRDGEQLRQSLEEARRHLFADKRQILEIDRLGREPTQVSVTVVALDGQPWPALIELREIEQQLKVDREERLLEQAQANRELLRNLAHEIKNPLGGLRGAAQLLEAELSDPALIEYTQVIIQEADRLQTLVDRLLVPHRAPRIVGDVNIHEVCERVRSLVLAEYPNGLRIVRDYDAAIPEFRGDKAQLIQAVLNVVRNAAEALSARIAAGDAEITLRTRVARQVTLAKQRFRLALELHVMDNGPGIPPELLDRIFHPLVSGREGGSGLGLTLTQTFVQQHEGVIECDSRPGLTDFRLLLPLP
ncbi:nitrogen regulation protein NR(II) [Pigmentiphaga sp. GD03639]|nr:MULTISPECIES: nitrogen regulation protein NR(II) [unclassified Pigmentiphaga]MDH2237956.1 nitrogen regulation protein NR(II) [Pigmentiphaga sp. GD03639]OVZ62788.1 PAS domain-containing sensor histidine kinase [Pigmentiphaga sp. NML030171]